MAICRGKTGSPSRACGRAGASQGRRHRHGWSVSNPCCSRKRRLRFLLSWHRMVILLERVRRQPCATWREHHWLVNSCAGDKRKTTGASEGDHSQALPRGRLRDFDNPGNAQIVKRDRTCRSGVKVKLQYLDVLGPKDIETAFRAASKGRADAVLVLAGPVLISHRTADCGPRGKEPAPSDIQ